MLSTIFSFSNYLHLAVLNILDRDLKVKKMSNTQNDNCSLSIVTMNLLRPHGLTAFTVLMLFLVPMSTILGQRNQGHKLKPTISDFSYGEHERHVLDFYKAESSSPTPLVLYIHGGGFTAGNKNTVNQETLNELLKAGISVAAIHL